MAVCAITLADKIVREFVATVEIPTGFGIDMNQGAAHKYTTYLSLDKSSVIYNVQEEVRPSVVTVPDLENPAQTMELACQSRVRVLKLTGPLFYNSIVAGFVPVSALNPDPTDVVISAPTAFASSNVIQIDDILGYACYECTMPDSVIDGFDIKIIQDTEFVITNTGAQIPHNEENQARFFAALQGHDTQTIYIHYTLVMTPKVITEP